MIYEDQTVLPGDMTAEESSATLAFCAMLAARGARLGVPLVDMYAWAGVSFLNISLPLILKSPSREGSDVSDEDPAE